MRNPALVAVGRFLFYHRNWLFPLLIAVLFLGMSPREPGALECWLDLVGVAAVLAGLSLRFLVIAATPVRRDGRDKRVDAAELRTSGLFSVCRNPLYVGNFLMALGFFLVHGAWPVILAGAILTWALYQAIIANEETFLRGRFGDAYTAYMASTNRWLPDPRRLGPALAGMRLDIGKGLRVERTVVLIGAVVLAAAFWYEAASPWPPLAAWLALAAGLAQNVVAYTLRARRKRGKA